MRCIAYSTAESYDLKNLSDFLGTKDQKSTLYNKEVLFLKKSPTSGIFFFDYGCVVFWNCHKKIEQHTLQILKDFSKNPFAKTESDEFDYKIGRSSTKTTLTTNDTVILSNNSILKKLVVSFALSQSVKLMTFEASVLQTVEETKFLPEHIALHGKSPLSRKAVARKMGRLFIVRHSVNLHSEMLDVPDFFWENPEYEGLYTTILKDLDVPQRIEILNRRMEMIQELFTLLGDDLNHQHSSLLEWIIIILISVEILLFLVKEVFLKI